jgi:hypothetical protein
MPRNAVVILKGWQMITLKQHQYLAALVTYGKLPVGLAEMSCHEFQNLLSEGLASTTFVPPFAIQHAYITPQGEAAWEVSSENTDRFIETGRPTKYTIGAGR